MLPVMSSAPSGRLRALSAYSLRGRSPGETNGQFLYGYVMRHSADELLNPSRDKVWVIKANIQDPRKALPQTRLLCTVWKV